MPLEIVQIYLRATHGRDFETAYQYISTPDRILRDRRKYIRSERSLSGFALDLAKRLAAGTEVWLIEQKLSASKAQLTVGYRAPTADEISERLLDWNPDKLNALSPVEQAGMIEALERLKKTGKMIAIEGRETFSLIREKTGWKVFLNWGSQQQVVVKATPPRSGELAVVFMRDDFFIKRQEPFQIDFKVTNRTPRELLVEVGHLFAPRQIEKQVEMIACGSLVPFNLRPRQTQEISSSYIFSGNVRGRKPLEIIYDLKVASAQSQRLPRANLLATK